MKTLSKLTINPEKVLKHEELINLIGGWEGTCLVQCPDTYFKGYGSGDSAADATSKCTAYWKSAGCECFCY